MDRDLRSKILERLEWVCRLAVAGLMLYAAFPKMGDPAAFAKAITNYKVSLPWIGQDYVYLTAVFMPALEMVVGIGLLFQRWKRASSLLASILLGMFTVLVLQAVLRGLNIDCGCFGSSELASAKATKVGWTKIAENLGWFAASIFVYRRSCPKKPRYRM